MRSKPIHLKGKTEVNLFKNGFVVARMDAEESSYISWPLSDLTDDKTAELLTGSSPSLCPVGVYFAACVVIVRNNYAVVFI